MAQVLTPHQRIKVREAHNLRGKVVSVGDDGNIADVRFDRHQAVYPYHVSEVEPEEHPCACVFCDPARPKTLRSSPRE
jgi:hypothetical protein